MSDAVTLLPIDSLQPNPLQPRGVITPESLSELIDSIRIHGIIQPLVVAHTPAGYQIIAGERRWRASKLVGLTEVPVRIIETSPQGMLEMAIVENVQRTDLNPIDRANSFERLINEFGLSNSDISVRVGKSPAFVSNTLRLLDLPDALKDGLISGVISEGHARALAAIPDTQAMIEAYKIILRTGGSVRQAEELSRRFKKNMHKLPKKAGFDTKTTNELIDRMAEELQSSLGENVNVKMRRSRVETAIHIVIRGNPEETEDKIQKIYRLVVRKEADDAPNLTPEPEPKEVETKQEEALPKTTTTNPIDQFYRNPFEPMVEENKNIESLIPKSKEDDFEDY